MAQVLQTKMVGYTTDRTGHVMAPQEIVYHCDGPQRRPSWLQKGVVIVSVVGLLWIFAGALVEIFASA